MAEGKRERVVFEVRRKKDRDKSDSNTEQKEHQSTCERRLKGVQRSAGRYIVLLGHLGRVKMKEKGERGDRDRHMDNMGQERE